MIVESWESEQTIESTISYVSPIIYKDSQTLLARTIVPNTKNVWRPGLFVTAKVVTNDSMVEVAVNRDAVQTLENEKVVFVKKDEELNKKRVKYEALGLW